MVTRRFADHRPAEHGALLPRSPRPAPGATSPRTASHSRALASAPYLNLPARVIAPALLGRFDCGHGRIERVPDFHVFHQGNANLPTLAQATRSSATWQGRPAAH